MRGRSDLHVSCGCELHAWSHSSQKTAGGGEEAEEVMGLSGTDWAANEEGGGRWVRLALSLGRGGEGSVWLCLPGCSSKPQTLNPKP